MRDVQREGSYSRWRQRWSALRRRRYVHAKRESRTRPRGWGSAVGTLPLQGPKCEGTGVAVGETRSGVPRALDAPCAGTERLRVLRDTGTSAKAS